MANAQPSALACGEAVEFTVYDFLKGIARRNEHKPYPEPEVAMIFKKSETDNAVDLIEVEMGLRKAYQEVSACRFIELNLQCISAYTVVIIRPENPNCACSQHLIHIV